MLPDMQAARVLAGYLNTQIDQIMAGDLGLRRGEDPIHDTRVAIRRLRSTLRVFRKALDEAAVGDLDTELKWCAGLLGEVRDCQVQQRRFSDALDELPDELILGPVPARIRNHLQGIELPARTRLSEAMDSERYAGVLEALRQLRVEPPVNQDITPKDLWKKARRAQRKADRRLASALRMALRTGDGALLHRARKAAKRARYAAELYRPLDQRAKRAVKHYKHIQTVLGDHQDTVVASETLRQLGITAGTTEGENGFTYGLLYAREQEIARRCRQEARRYGPGA
jgi:CHAD domain-containing protein